MTPYETEILARARARAVSVLTEHGEQTFRQIRSRAGAGERSLARVLGDLQAEGLVVAHFVPGPFPRKLVYAMREQSERRGRRGGRPLAVGRITNSGRVQVKVYLPTYLYEAMRKEAADERRTFSEQVVVRLEEGLA